MGSYRVEISIISGGLPWTPQRDASDNFAPGPDVDDPRSWAFGDAKPATCLLPAFLYSSSYFSLGLDIATQQLPRVDYLPSHTRHNDLSK